MFEKTLFLLFYSLILPQNEDFFKAVNGEWGEV